MREKRHILPRSWRLYLVVLKVVACFASWCIGRISKRCVALVGNVTTVKRTATGVSTPLHQYSDCNYGRYVSVVPSIPVYAAENNKMLPPSSPSSLPFCHTNEITLAQVSGRPPMSVEASVFRNPIEQDYPRRSFRNSLGPTVTGESAVATTDNGSTTQQTQQLTYSGRA